MAAPRRRTRCAAPRTCWSIPAPRGSAARGSRGPPTSIRRGCLHSPSTIFPEPAGRIIDELSAIRMELRRALGIGQGVTGEPNCRGANRRGRIAEYAPAISEELGATHCLVITESGYSRAALQQTTIPLLSAMEYDAAPGDVLVQNTSAWQGRFALRVHPILLAVPLITTVHERDSIARFTRTIVSADTMRDVEAALLLHFGV